VGLITLHLVMTHPPAYFRPGLGSVALAPTWKRLFVGSPLLASTFDSSIRLTLYFPRLQQFMNMADNLGSSAAKFKFSDEDADVEVYPREEVKIA